MSTPAVDPTRCPLCTTPNACQIAAGSSTCWYFDTTVPASVLARVPAEAQGVACVCRGCATQPDPETSDPNDPSDSSDRRAGALRWVKR